MRTKSVLLGVFVTAATPVMAGPGQSSGSAFGAITVIALLFSVAALALAILSARRMMDALRGLQKEVGQLAVQASALRSDVDTLTHRRTQAPTARDESRYGGVPAGEGGAGHVSADQESRGLGGVLDGRDAAWPLRKAASPTEGEQTGGGLSSAVDWSNLIQMVEQGVRIDDALRPFRARLDDPQGRNHEAVGTVLDWLTWITEKLPYLRTLRDESLVEKVKAWHRRLDYYLYTDPAIVLLRYTDASDHLLVPALVQGLPAAARCGQRMTTEFLARQGITRIEVPEGSAFDPKTVERSSQAPEPTANPTLHDRVFRIEPGEGGYRYNGRVLMPSLARRYEHRPTST